MALLNCTANLEEKEKYPLEKTQVKENPVETAPRNSRFLSLLVVRCSLLPNSVGYHFRSGPGKPNQRKVSSWTFCRGIPEQNFNVNRACFPKEKQQTEFTKMGEIHELFVLALSLVWFAGAAPDHCFWEFQQISCKLPPPRHVFPALEDSIAFKGCWRGAPDGVATLKVRKGAFAILTLWIKGLEHLEKWSKVVAPSGAPPKELYDVYATNPYTHQVPAANVGGEEGRVISHALVCWRNLSRWLNNVS